MKREYQRTISHSGVWVCSLGGGIQSPGLGGWEGASQGSAAYMLLGKRAAHRDPVPAGRVCQQGLLTRLPPAGARPASRQTGLETSTANTQQKRVPCQARSLPPPLEEQELSWVYPGLGVDPGIFQFHF